MKVSIVVVTYNSANYIERLLESIASFNKGLDYEIIVVDNDSKDDTVKLVKSQKSKLKIIESKENGGFAKGINTGVKEAGGDYLLFINPDAAWHGGSIQNLINIFKNNDKAGVVGGKILKKDGISEKSAGRFLKLKEVALTAFSLDEAFGVRFSPRERIEVDFVSGGFMGVRKDLFDKLKGFDENLFMYVEDMEFCYRVKKEGMKILFDPSIEIIHESHGSSNRSFAIENIHRCLLYFHKKHGSKFSYTATKALLRSKAFILVLLGKIINNRYLTETYSGALRLKI